jgi:hypothetical protein
MISVYAIDLKDYTLDYNYGKSSDCSSLPSVYAVDDHISVCCAFMTEASYYGVYASGHPELARLYWAPMVDGMAAARRGAVDRAKAHNLSNCAPTALHYNAHISPWGFGDFDEDWELKSVRETEIFSTSQFWSNHLKFLSVQGQHMMWNGVFGALLFINDLEYLGSSNKCVVHPFCKAIKLNCELTLSPGRILLRLPQKLFHEHDSPAVGRVT